MLPSAGAKLPERHAVGFTLPLPQAEPAGQRRHSDAAPMPELFECVPGGHANGLDDPKGQ